LLTTPDASISFISIEGASAEPYRPAFGEQLAAMRQNAEVAKFDDRRWIRQAKHGRQL
jgi:hypothetical protein